MLSEPVRTMVLLGILTGMRIGEILGLRRRDVNFSSGQIWIEQACYRGLLGSPKTKGSKRTLPLPKRLVIPLARILRHAKRIGEDDLVFQTRNGTPLNDTNLLHRHLKPAGGKIGGSLAELACAQAHPRYAVTDVGGFFAGRTSTAGSQQDVHDSRGLYPANSRTSAGSGRETFAIGDQW